MFVTTPQLIKLEHEYRYKAIEEENRRMVNWFGSTGLQRKPTWVESLRRIGRSQDR